MNRKTASQITDAELDELYDRAEQTEILHRVHETLADVLEWLIVLRACIPTREVNRD